MLRESGPITVAAFMQLALYDPQHGYYARAAQRSGRAGDFFTSVDVGPLFGELLAVQIAEMAALLGAGTPGVPNPNSQSPIRNPHCPISFDLVEAGAGNGRLSADMLRAAKRSHPLFYDSVRLHLVETSGVARAQQAKTLGDAAERLASSTPSLPDSFEGVLVANELLDAMPTHVVSMTEDGLKEIYVVPYLNPQAAALLSPQAANRTLEAVAGPPSTTRLAQYLDRLGVRLEPGWRAEINLRAVEWVGEAARRLRRGFMILIDYGHEAPELYSASHSAGTLTSFSAHHSRGSDAPPGTAAWLERPGEQDITSHVDFTSIQAAAESEGMTTIALLDQTYFLIGLLSSLADPDATLRNRQFKTLILPGGLGSTMKVLILGKGVGRPPLKGTSYGVRVT